VGGSKSAEFEYTTEMTGSKLIFITILFFYQSSCSIFWKQLFVWK